MLPVSSMPPRKPSLIDMQYRIVPNNWTLLRNTCTSAPRGRNVALPMHIPLLDVFRILTGSRSETNGFSS